MLDGRRRPWLAMDVYYYDSNLAVAIREKCGIVGVAVFDAFLRACKRNQIEGELTYSSESDFLSQVGLACAQLVDEAGDKWELDMLWRLTGHHKNTVRTRRGRLTNIKVTRWTRWQNPRPTRKNTSDLPREYDAVIHYDKDKDNDNPPISPRGGLTDDGGQFHPEFCACDFCERRKAQ